MNRLIRVEEENDGWIRRRRSTWQLLLGSIGKGPWEYIWRVNEGVLFGYLFGHDEMMIIMTTASLEKLLGKSGSGGARSSVRRPSVR